MIISLYKPNHRHHHQPHPLPPAKSIRAQNRIISHDQPISATLSSSSFPPCISHHPDLHGAVQEGLHAQSGTLHHPQEQVNRAYTAYICHAVWSSMAWCLGLRLTILVVTKDIPNRPTLQTHSRHNDKKLARRIQKELLANGPIRPCAANKSPDKSRPLS